MSKKTLSLLIIVVLVLSLIVTVDQVQKARGLRSSAATRTGQEEPAPSPKEPEYVPGEIIVKFKPDITHLKSNQADIDRTEVSFSELDQATLPSGLKELNQKHSVKKIEKIFKGTADPEKELVKIKERWAKDIASKARVIDQDALAKIDLSRVYKVTFADGVETKAARVTLAADPDVVYAELNYIYELFTPPPLTFIPNDPRFNEQWALNNTGQNSGKVDADIDAPEGWMSSLGSPGTVIAIIDTGIDYTHPDLGGCLGPGCKVIGGMNFAGAGIDPMDVHGHGTHVAGIAAGVTSNNFGIAGVCPLCSLMAVRIFDSDGITKSSWILTGLEYAVNFGARVINNSWGGAGYSQSLQDLISWGTAQGAVFVASAGNSYNEAPMYPASYHNVISVAALDRNDDIAAFSSYGKYVDVAAPGVDILSATPKGNFAAWSGTSMAAPHASGLAGLLLSGYPLWGYQQVDMVMKISADQAAWNKYIGWGRINVHGAFENHNVTTATAKISYPFWDALMVAATSNDVVSVRGTAAGTGYQLEYGSGIYPQNWSLVASGESVSDGILASWNILSLAKGNYTLRLTVSDSLGISRDRVLVNVTRLNENYSLSMVPGWPRKMNTLRRGYSSPAVADINNDSKNEVIVGGAGIDFYGGSDGGYLEPHIYAWDYQGNPLPGWPKYQEGGPIAPSGDSIVEGIFTSPAVLDLDGNGKKEIVMGGYDGYLYVWNANGSNFNTNWPKNIGALIGNFSKKQSPVIYDIDNDGKYEIFTAAQNAKIYAWHADGTPLISTNSDGMFYSFPYQSWGVPAINVDIYDLSVADINNDGDGEVLVGAWWGADNGHFYVFNAKGEVLQDDLGRGRVNYIAVGDLDHNGTQEIATNVQRVAIADIDGDSYLETLIPGNGQLNILDYNGNPKINPITFSTSTYKLRYSGPVVGDIDGDKDQEIVLATAQGSLSGTPPTDLTVYAWHHDGSVVGNWPLVQDSTNEILDSGDISTPTITDLDKDGRTDIVVVGQNGFVYAIATGGQYDPDAIQWGRYKHDDQNTGWYDYPADTIKPHVIITNPAFSQEGVTISGLVNLQVSAWDNRRVKNVEFWFCGLRFSPCDAPGYFDIIVVDQEAPWGTSFDTTKQINGSYLLKAVAYDYNGNNSGYYNTNDNLGSWLSVELRNEDTVAPTAPGNLRISSQTTTSVSLLWDQSSDNVGVAGYWVTRNGNVLNANQYMGNIANYTDSGLTCGIQYFYSVAAYDYALNPSGASNIVNVVIPCPPVQLTPSADAHVYKDSSGTNYGAKLKLEVDGSPVKIIYMKFDLSSLAGKTISSAKLKFKNADSSSATQNIKRVADTSWGETTIKYSNRPAMGTLVTSFKGGATGIWREIDITTAVKEKQGKLMSIGIDSTGSDGLDFYSKENPTDKPSLVVAF